MIRVPSPAKLNLFLHITGRRDNGYHELQTIFQLIDLYDWMTFEPIADGMIHIEGLNEVALEQNLIYRAAQYLNRMQKSHRVKYSSRKIFRWVQA
jgi:4-diphosphocytidyl-2-C-methyl-D-erythritol kinase